MACEPLRGGWRGVDGWGLKNLGFCGNFFRRNEGICLVEIRGSSLTILSIRGDLWTKFVLMT